MHKMNYRQIGIFHILGKHIILEQRMIELFVRDLFLDETTTILPYFE